MQPKMGQKALGGLDNLQRHMKIHESKIWRHKDDVEDASDVHEGSETDDDVGTENSPAFETSNDIEGRHIPDSGGIEEPAKEDEDLEENIEDQTKSSEKQVVKKDDVTCELCGKLFQQNITWRSIKDKRKVYVMRVPKCFATKAHWWFIKNQSITKENLSVIHVWENLTASLIWRDILIQDHPQLVTFAMLCYVIQGT